jgi:hypothetical protein
VEKAEEENFHAMRCERKKNGRKVAEKFKKI